MPSLTKYIYPLVINLPNKVMLIEILSLDDLNTYKDHRRLGVFAAKGVVCSYCGKLGMYLLKTKHADGSTHIDVYTQFAELMTVDHIHPLSKGGSDNILNKTPCCAICNKKKDNKVL